jgi:dTDP-4-amino-4,6-dideoxygalactose transaminase
MIPYGRQQILQSDVDAVLGVLRSDFLTQGPVVPRFESAVAQHVGSKHAIAANSATSALHIACMALGLGPGDWLWTSPITFVASSNCALYCGARVDFVDIDPRTYNLDPAAIEARITPRTRAIMPVHLYGHPADMPAIEAIAARHGLTVIEDACRKWWCRCTCAASPARWRRFARCRAASASAWWKTPRTPSAAATRTSRSATGAIRTSPSSAFIP